MASNYSRLGEPKKARWTIIYSSAILLFLIVASVMLTDDSSSSGGAERGAATWITIALAYGFYYIAKKKQGPAYVKHVELGGATASGWSTAGYSLGALGFLMVPLLLIVFGVTYLTGPEQTEEANRLIVEGNKLVVDANRYAEQYDKGERDLLQAISDQDNDRIQRITEAQIYSLTQGARLWREAAEKNDGISKMRVNSTFKEYISIQANSQRKQAEKADVLAERAEVLRATDHLTLQQKADKRATLLERAKKLDTEARALVAQAETLARQHPTAFGGTPP